MSQDQPVALRAHITPEQVMSVLNTRREKAKAAAKAEMVKAREAQHQADIAEAVSWAVTDLTQEMEAKFQECLEGLMSEYVDPRTRAKMEA